ncbi:MAG: RNA polymerase factor sigma-54 [Clostridia bacterium]|nr:RNA polymerase factor sigma-54 [Clostridia bacterium]
MDGQRLQMEQGQKLSQTIQIAIHLLSYDLFELNEQLVKAVQENPALEYVPPVRNPQDYAAQIRTHLRSGRGGSRETAVPEVAQPVTMMEDLEEQLRFCELDQETYKLAADMLWRLNPRGYFPVSLDAYADEMNVTVQAARKALEAVQTLEPVGIGARSVEECLRLQLDARPDADPLCYDLVRVHLLDIGKGNIRQIVRETGAAVGRVQACIDTIRALNPIPCVLSEGETEFIMPEFSVELDETGELQIQFNNDYFPTFRLDGTFRQLSERLGGDEQVYARKMIHDADQLLHAVDVRQQTMEKVAQIIVREQHAFFRGQYSLLPLRIAAVADEIGVHETTVYRAIQNKYLVCARGTFALGHFFQREVSGGVSTERTKEMIQEICQEKGRISDQKIADILAGRGVKISRRTVQKYRSQMAIDSSFYRNQS